VDAEEAPLAPVERKIRVVNIAVEMGVRHLQCTAATGQNVRVKPPPR
jgi:hypothetical protein